MLIFCVQTNWVCPSGTQRFCKNDSDSSRVRVTKNRDSSRVTDSSRAVIGFGMAHLLSLV